jgi:hypothetical protein
LAIERRFSVATLRYLPAYLHLQPLELKKRLIGAVHQLLAGDCRICCLYGRCFPDIDEVLQEFDLPRLPGNHCFEILLGLERFKKLTNDRPGTFFVEKELLLNFDAYCWIPLELCDPQLREWYFESYRYIVYIRQPLDPDLNKMASQVADRLNLCLSVVDADYRELNLKLNRLLLENSSA